MIVEFKDLNKEDLVIDRIYKGGELNGTAGEPISKIMSCENSGGFRVAVKEKNGKINYKIKYIVLYSTGEDLNWNDTIDLELGRFTYYGDNKQPGKKLHDTPKKGNLILKETFKRLQQGNRDEIPPIFIFTKYNNRDVKFRGLAVPGDSRLKAREELIAEWHSYKGERYQNYKSIFTILNVSDISREWINDLNNGIGVESIHAPEVWKKWIEKGEYNPLIAKKDTLYRTMDEQVPSNLEDIKMIKEIKNYFTNPYDFEVCAANIFQLTTDNVISYDMTRSVADGGRDAIGVYRIGNSSINITTEFSLEAKCYDLKNGVGVKETSRLISRIRHRQFGVLVTTSYVSKQAYEEIIEDQHPIIIISAIDIVNILKEAGYKNSKEVKQWLNDKF